MEPTPPKWLAASLLTVEGVALVNPIWTAPRGSSMMKTKSRHDATPQCLGRTNMQILPVIPCSRNHKELWMNPHASYPSATPPALCLCRPCDRGVDRNRVDRSKSVDASQAEGRSDQETPTATWGGLAQPHGKNKYALTLQQTPLFAGKFLVFLNRSKVYK